MSSGAAPPTAAPLRILVLAGAELAEAIRAQQGDLPRPLLVTDDAAGGPVDVAVLVPRPEQVDLSAAAYAELADAIRSQAAPHVLVCNASTIDPGDQRHAYRDGTRDTPAVCANRFNLALMALSEERGFSVVDVDRLLAEMGADGQVSAFLRYSPRAWSAVGAECLRILKDRGAFDLKPAATGGTEATSGAALMRLTLPFVNRLSSRGSVVTWHVQEGAAIRAGQDLVDVRMDIAGREVFALGELIQDSSAADGPRRGGWASGSSETQALNMVVRVTACEDGILQAIRAAAGARTTVEDLLAIVRTEGEAPIAASEDAVAAARPFRVAVNTIS